jgi:hypothetical protein
MRYKRLWIVVDFSNGLPTNLAEIIAYLYSWPARVQLVAGSNPVAPTIERMTEPPSWLS